MKNIEADLIVIGSGPSGQKGAIQASKLGAKVILIEKDPYPGGVSINRGTIPSKTLREAILELTDFHRRNFYGEEHEIQKVSINDLYTNLNKVLIHERNLIKRQLVRNNIQLLQGNASFHAPHEVLVHDDNGQKTHLIKAKFIMIACGSTPRRPVDVPFNKNVILDSNNLLKLDCVPESMLVLGGGIIGAEYASFFAALGTKVTVIDKKSTMLPKLDSEISTHLQGGLKQLGLNFLGNKLIKGIENKNNRAHVYFEDGGSEEAEVLLYALGRIANVETLNLETIGLELNRKGNLTVNPMYQTELPHVYAVGDVIGTPSLASTSMEQGRLAACHAFQASNQTFPSFYPFGIYTIPEISYCGYTEQELQELNFRYEVGRAYFYEIARSQIAADKMGLFKILFHADTLEILGVHVLGRGATEVIHIGQIAMSFHADVDYFIHHVFNYPTYAEGFRIAALNGYNKIKKVR